MQSIIRDGVRPNCHELDALAIARADQTSNIGGAHPLPSFVAQAFKIRRNPPLKILLPALVDRQPPSKLAFHESRNQRHGNPKNHTSAKLVLGSFHAPKALLISSHSTHPPTYRRASHYLGINMIELGKHRRKFPFAHRRISCSSRHCA